MRKVLVTAGASGIGKEIAAAFLAAGESVYTCDINQVDLTGTFLVTKAAIPYLISSGNGVIVIMSSAAGRFGYPNRSPYSTVKWGLIGFMKTLSTELGVHNIRANAILPGAVDGERIQRVFQGRAEATGKPSAWRAPRRQRRA